MIVSEAECDGCSKREPLQYDYREGDSTGYPRAWLTFAELPDTSSHEPVISKRYGFCGWACVAVFAEQRAEAAAITEIKGLVCVRRYPPSEDA